MPHAELTGRVERILATGTCNISGQNKTRFDIVVPYAVLIDTAGQARQVVGKEIGCADIERLVGEVAVSLAEEGDIKAQHKTGDRWYASEVQFARGDHNLGQRMADNDKVICRRAESVLGSRVATKRVCRTGAEWRLFETDRQQLQRDIQNSPDLGSND
jgi:hypothetical protein